MAFPGYIAGFGLFNYAFLPPAKDLLDLYYRITESAYFTALGFSPSYYNAESNTFDKRAIKNTIQQWHDKYKKGYPKLQADMKLLNFESMTAFTKSYFLMIRGLDMTKAGR